MSAKYLRDAADRLEAMLTKATAVVPLSNLGITTDEIPWAKRVLEAARAYSDAPRATREMADDLLAAADDM